MCPSGAVGLMGPYVNMPFAKHLVEKIGVEPQVIRRREYKVANEKGKQRVWKRERRRRVVFCFLLSSPLLFSPSLPLSSPFSLIFSSLSLPSLFLLCLLSLVQSAMELFTEEKCTPANREQLELLYAGLYEEMVHGIAGARMLSEAKVKDIISKGKEIFVLKRRHENREEILFPGSNR